MPQRWPPQTRPSNGRHFVDDITLEVKLLLAASFLAAWLGLRQQRYAGSTRYAYLFGILLLSAGLRHVGVWH